MPKWVPVGLIGEWRKAKSSIYNGNCVEVADLPSGEIVLRDSKDPEGQGLAFTPLCCIRPLKTLPTPVKKKPNPGNATRKVEYRATSPSRLHQSALAKLAPMP